MQELNGLSHHLDVFLFGRFGNDLGFGFDVIQGVAVGDDSRNDAIASDVGDGTHSVHEPINGKDVSKAIGHSAAVEDRIVGGDDQDQTGGRDGSGTDASKSGNDDEQDEGGKVDLFSVQYGQPDAGTDKVDSTSVHVDSRSKGNDELADNIGDNASGLDSLEGGGDGGGRRGAGKGKELCGNNVLEVGERIGLGQKRKEANVNKDNLQAPCDKGGGHEQTNVGEHGLEVALLSNARGDQRHDGEGCQENDPVDDAGEDLVHFSQNFDKLAVLHRCEGGAKDACKEQDGGERAVGKGGNNVVGNNLFKDTLVDGIGKRHFGDGLFDFSAVDLRFVEFHKHEGRKGSKEGGSNGRDEVQTNNGPSNRGGLADAHHVDDGNDDVDKDKRKDKALEGTDEEITDETEPLDGNLLVGGVFGLPVGEADTEGDTEHDEDEDGQDWAVVEKSAASALGLDFFLLFSLGHFVLLGHLWGGCLFLGHGVGCLL
jgi:hypothetical protein